MSTITIKSMLELGIYFWLLVFGIFIGCTKKSPYDKRLSNWSLIHAGMTKTEVDDLIGKAPQELTEGECLYLWYPSGLSEKELMKPGLQVEAYVVAITNGVVMNCFMPQR